MDTKWFNELYERLEDAVDDYKWDEIRFREVNNAIDALVLQARLDRTREILELLAKDGKYAGAAQYVDRELGYHHPDEIKRAAECPILDENGEWNDGRD